MEYPEKSNQLSEYAESIRQWGEEYPKKSWEQLITYPKSIRVGLAMEYPEISLISISLRGTSCVR